MSVKDPWNQSWGMERGPAFWKRWPSSWVCTIALNCNIFNHGHETDSRRAEGRTGGSHSQHYLMPHTVGRGMIIMRYRFASFFMLCFADVDCLVATFVASIRRFTFVSILLPTRSSQNDCRSSQTCTEQGTKVCRYSRHSAGSQRWPVPMLK